MIDDTALDTLLAASRPAVEDDPARVTRARAAAERNRSSRPWLRRAAVLGTAGAAVLAVGTGAAATVGLPFVYHVAPVEYTQTVASGDHCYTTYEFVPDGAASPAALAAAQEALATLDISALDISDEAQVPDRVEREGNLGRDWPAAGLLLSGGQPRLHRVDGVEPRRVRGRRRPCQGAGVQDQKHLDDHRRGLRRHEEGRGRR